MMSSRGRSTATSVLSSKRSMKSKGCRERTVASGGVALHQLSIFPALGLDMVESQHFSGAGL